jgi:hypothetical protein
MVELRKGTKHDTTPSLVWFRAWYGWKGALNTEDTNKGVFSCSLHLARGIIFLEPIVSVIRESSSDQHADLVIG